MRGDAAALARELAPRARPLETDRDLDPLLERLAGVRVVLVGEASHGTHEYYAWRARLTRRLVEEQGARFVAVEGDWPDCYRINRAVRHYPGAPDDPLEALGGFRRWPTWMWANWEVAAFVRWLADRNAARPAEARCGFYGLDVYSLWESLEAVTGYLREHQPDALEAARAAYRCFEPHQPDGFAYARSTALVPRTCEGEVLELLRALRRRAEQGPERRDDDPEADFDAERNARVALDAERYYRSALRGGGASWNVRDEHMMDTLEALDARHPGEGPAVVWAHNTHVGDARATSMAAEGMLNLGQLARERYGAEEVALVGFGGHRGRVIAGRSWDAPHERMPLPAAEEGSWEDLLHHARGAPALLFAEDLHEPALLEPRGHRAVGVVYHPERERYGNYVPTVLAERYDAFLHLEETGGLHPLGLEPRDAGPPDTYPWGF